MEVKEQKRVKEWEHHQKRKKGENYERAECQVVQKLKQSSKYVILAIVFDYFHYSLWELFPEAQQLYVYDASQSIAFLLYIYALYCFIPEQLPIMKAITSMWLWFSIGDAVTMVYGSKTLESIPLEYYCLYFNIVMLCYKYKDNLYLMWEIGKFNLKIDRHEGVFA